MLIAGWAGKPLQYGMHELFVSLLMKIYCQLPFYSFLLLLALIEQY